MFRKQRKMEHFDGRQTVQRKTIKVNKKGEKNND